MGSLGNIQKCCHATRGRGCTNFCDWLYRIVFFNMGWHQVAYILRGDMYDTISKTAILSLLMKSPSLSAQPQPLLQSLGLRPWACKMAGTVEQTGGFNFSIKGKNKIPACQTWCTTLHFSITEGVRKSPNLCDVIYERPRRPRAFYLG